MASLLELAQGDAVRFKSLVEILDTVPHKLKLEQLAALGSIASKTGIVSQIYLQGQQVDQVGYQFFTMVGFPGRALDPKWCEKIKVSTPKLKLVK